MANLILSLAFQQIALMVFFFVPVVLIEAAVLSGALGRRWSACVWPVFLANVTSSLLGIPLLFLADLGAWSWEAPDGWAGPLVQAFRSPPEGNPGIAIAASAIAFLILFVLSALVEGVQLLWIHRGARYAEPRRLWRASWGMNATSYALLLGLMLLGGA
jgi:hypothetical protein